MPARARVNATLDFHPVDYVPRYDLFWGGFVQAWRDRHGLPPLPAPILDDIEPRDAELRTYYELDLLKVTPVEETAPSGARNLKRDGNAVIVRDGWGRTVRRLAGSPYGETLEVPLAEKRQLDTIRFESPADDHRFTSMLAMIREENCRPIDPYIFIKVGGPYLRSSFLRGEMQWYLDLLEDKPFACALASRMAEHLTDVGLEAIRRSGIESPGIWIFDDVAANHGPLISTADFERVFHPLLRKMVRAFKSAGAGHVGFHSDGDIRPLLDGLVDAGITVINPVEPRAGMDVVELRRRYGRRLAFVGGLCNSQILPFGSNAEVRRHVDHVMSIAGDGGLVIGSHTIANDISPDRYEFVTRILQGYGRPCRD